MPAATATMDEITTMNLFTGTASDAFFGGEVLAPMRKLDLQAQMGSDVTASLLRAADAARPAW
jgi:hypothetical protein